MSSIPRKPRENDLRKFVSNQRNGSPYHLQIVDLYDKRRESSHESKDRLVKRYISLRCYWLRKNVANASNTTFCISKLRL